ncbi:hypothetical protein [Streptomyces sp. B3I8]|uniref:hypothetical protein n=1 Tax=Streptomyces sp. B3I8 TaxID=3042303 RepID=UPI00277DB9F5|nr:hypothetical protein [Streptomyces sp. B3I8]MDQ0790397.1 hypothetical protein [Streptomyces sp. B3I8]
MTASLMCRKILSLEAGSVYAWETGEGDAGNILTDPEGSVARPCTPEGTITGRMVLEKNVGNVENVEPDSDPRIRDTFLVVAAAILREAERQGRLPDKVTRVYW